MSPVAEELRRILSGAPWACVGLGLPVVSSLKHCFTCFTYNAAILCDVAKTMLHMLCVG